MNILVTGAGGYIGRHLVPYLRAGGHEVRKLYRANQSESAKWDWVGGDLDGRLFTNLAECSGATMLEDIGSPVPHTLIHLAGRIDIALRPNPVDKCMPPIPGEQDIAALYRDNVLATANVLDYCLRAGVKHLIFASTQAVIGMGRGPLEHYAASKRAAEEVLRIGARQGLAVMILRLPGIYGGDRRSGAVWDMCYNALTRSQIQVNVGYPLHYTAMHIEDVAAAIAEIARVPLPSGVNWGDITDGNPISLTILAQEIADLVLKGVDVVYPMVEQPISHTWRPLRPYLEHWQSKPRRERLLQVLEEVRQSLGD